MELVSPKQESGLGFLYFAVPQAYFCHVATLSSRLSGGLTLNVNHQSHCCRGTMQTNWYKSPLKSSDPTITKQHCYSVYSSAAQAEFSGLLELSLTNVTYLLRKSFSLCHLYSNYYFIPQTQLTDRPSAKFPLMILHLRPAQYLGCTFITALNIT